MNIVTIQKVRWPGGREVRSENYTLFYGGTGSHQWGTGFIVIGQEQNKYRLGY